MSKLVVNCFDQPTPMIMTSNVHYHGGDDDDDNDDDIN